MSTFTMLPTMVNPEACKTLAELRTELHRANVNIFMLADQSQANYCAAQELRTTLANIAYAHTSGQTEALKELLDDLMTRHKGAVQLQ